MGVRNIRSRVRSAMWNIQAQTWRTSSTWRGKVHFLINHSNETLPSAFSPFHSPARKSVCFIFFQKTSLRPIGRRETFSHLNSPMVLAGNSTSPISFAFMYPAILVLGVISSLVGRLHVYVLTVPSNGSKWKSHGMWWDRKIRKVFRHSTRGKNRLV